MWHIVLHLALSVDTTEFREDNVVVVEQKREDEKRAETDEISEENKLENSDEILEKQQIDQNDAEEFKNKDVQDDIINNEAITDEIGIDSDGNQLAEQDQDETEASLTGNNENKASSTDSEGLWLKE